MAAEESAAGAKRSRGLLGSVKNLAATLVAVAQTRLQLLANEIQEESLRLCRLWLLSIIAVFFLAFSVLLFTLLVVAAYWDSNRLLAIGGFATLYLIIGIVLAIELRRRAAVDSRLFEASLGEFAKDQEKLSS
jgi:uncharacterized membrane protein YqjE